MFSRAKRSYGKLAFGIRARVQYARRQLEFRGRTYDHIYHLHIRKTAGTALNGALLGGDIKTQEARLHSLRKTRHTLSFLMGG